MRALVIPNVYFAGLIFKRPTQASVRTPGARNNQFVLLPGALIFNFELGGHLLTDVIKKESCGSTVEGKSN